MVQPPAKQHWEIPPVDLLIDCQRLMIRDDHDVPLVGDKVRELVQREPNAERFQLARGAIVLGASGGPRREGDKVKRAVLVDLTQRGTQPVVACVTDHRYCPTRYVGGETEVVFDARDGALPRLL